MKFLVDAQLPRRLSLELARLRHDSLHTLDLLTGNRTPDADIAALATRDRRVVITKDRDFVASFLLRGAPPKLVLMTTVTSQMTPYSSFSPPTGLLWKRLSRKTILLN